MPEGVGRATTARVLWLSWMARGQSHSPSERRTTSGASSRLMLPPLAGDRVDHGQLQIRPQRRVVDAVALDRQNAGPVVLLHRDAAEADAGVDVGVVGT